jgi:hypothetical protein
VVTFTEVDDAVWAAARDSGEPARWVQYFVSPGAPKNKAAAKALLTPLFGNPDRFQSTPASLVKADRGRRSFLNRLNLVLVQALRC